MRIGLLAEKIGMSRFFDKDKTNHSVTVLKVRDCKVVSVNNFEKNVFPEPISPTKPILII